MTLIPAVTTLCRGSLVKQHLYIDMEASTGKTVLKQTIVFFFLYHFCFFLYPPSSLFYPSTFRYTPHIFLYLPYSAPSGARSIIRHYIHSFRLYERSLELYNTSLPANPRGPPPHHPACHSTSPPSSTLLATPPPPGPFTPAPHLRPGPTLPAILPPGPTRLTPISRWHHCCVCGRGVGGASLLRERGVSTVLEPRHRGRYAAWEGRHIGVRCGRGVRGVTAAWQQREWGIIVA